MAIKCSITYHNAIHTSKWWAKLGAKVNRFYVDNDKIVVMYQQYKILHSLPRHTWYSVKFCREATRNLIHRFKISKFLRIIDREVLKRLQIFKVTLITNYDHLNKCLHTSSINPAYAWHNLLPCFKKEFFYQFVLHKLCFTIFFVLQLVVLHLCPLGCLILIVQAHVSKSVVDIL